MTIDYKKLAWLLLPTFLRRQLMMAVSSVLVLPLQRMHDKHREHCDARMYRLAHTSQTCHMKAALNDEFGISDYSAGFQIDDIDAPGVWLVAWDEADTFADRHLVAHDMPTSIAWDEEEMRPTVAFRILVPTSVDWNDDNLARIKSVVNTYRLASRTFTIQKTF